MTQLEKEGSESLAESLQWLECCEVLATKPAFTETSRGNHVYNPHKIHNLKTEQLLGSLTVAGTESRENRTQVHLALHGILWATTPQSQPHFVSREPREEQQRPPSLILPLHHWGRQGSKELRVGTWRQEWKQRRWAETADWPASVACSGTFCRPDPLPRAGMFPQ